MKETEFLKDFRERTEPIMEKVATSSANISVMMFAVEDKGERVQLCNRLSGRGDLMVEGLVHTLQDPKTALPFYRVLKEAIIRSGVAELDDDDEEEEGPTMDC